MPWNQPGSGGDKDPWGQKNGQQDGPPDLDEMFREAKKKLDSLLGKKNSGNGSGNGSGGSSGGDRPEMPQPGAGVIILGLIVALGFWAYTGIYTVDEGSQAVELRFGKHTVNKEAGLHWHWPAPIESVEIVDIKQVYSVEVGYRSSGQSKNSVPREALMLTQDENIIDIQFAVHYDVKSPTDLLFNVSEYNPTQVAESVVRQATESAVREIVGGNTFDFAITDGRAAIEIETKVLVQNILDRYKTGIHIIRVEMQNAQPPKEVKNAFDDVVKAREDKVALKSLAEAYANDIIPKARGTASRILQEGEAYKASITAKADGEASRFTQILSEYVKAPEVTRDRLYIEAMEEVLSRSSKLIIDQKEGNSVMYLPIDQLMKNRSGSGGVSSIPGQITNSSDNFSINATDSRSNSRSVERSTRN